MLQQLFGNPLKVSPLLFALAIPAALTACGGGDTKIVERDPIPIEDDHDHDHDEDVTQGRLLVAIKDQPKVAIWDIKDAALLEEYTLTEPASALYASPGYRYGFVIQRLANRVNVVDSGLSQEDHGDHKDDIIEAPRWLAFATDKTRPTHFTATATQAVIFYDGNGDTTTPAQVGVYTEATIKNNTAGNTLEYTTHMHGAAQARGDYLLSTIRDPLTATSTLPDKVGLYKASNNLYTEQQIFSETCPGLHGSAQNKTQVAFGCTDGVLVITQTGDNFSAKKIANPANFSATTRIGTLFGDEHRAEFVGIAAGQFFAVNANTGTITPINWIDSSNAVAPTALGYGFADEGELFVILDNQGKLHLLNTNNWTISTRIQAITSNLSALPTGSRFELALTPGHNIYVSDPIANQIKQIDLDEAKVSGSLQLTGTPAKIVWIGIAEPAGNHH